MNWLLVTMSPAAALWHRPAAEMPSIILSRLDATGTATIVTNVRDGNYETDGRAYLGLKRDARDIKLQALEVPGSGAAERLANSRPCGTEG